MSKFTQKHAQIAMCSKLKQQNFHKLWKKSNPQNRNLQKISSNTNNIHTKQAQKQATRKSSKKTKLHKKQAHNRGKTAKLATLS